MMTGPYYSMLARKMEGCEKLFMNTRIKNEIIDVAYIN